MSELVVSLHDVAPSKAELCRRWVEVLDERNIRATLLVVPGQWNGKSLVTSPAFVEWLHEVQERGHEIALHGLHHTSDARFHSTQGRHLVGKVMARGSEEFWHLPYAEAHRRIRIGQEILRDCGFNPLGFVAPGWLMSADTMRVLRQSELKYTTTHTHFIDLQSSYEETMPSLSQRPNSSLSKVGIAFNRVAVETARALNKSLRLAIHPNDLVNKRIRQSNVSLVDRLMNSGYDILTYAEKHSALRVGQPPVISNDIV